MSPGFERVLVTAVAATAGVMEVVAKAAARVAAARVAVMAEAVMVAVAMAEEMAF